MLCAFFSSWHLHWCYTSSGGWDCWHLNRRGQGPKQTASRLCPHLQCQFEKSRCLGEAVKTTTFVTSCWQITYLYILCDDWDVYIKHFCCQPSVVVVLRKSNLQQFELQGELGPVFLGHRFCSEGGLNTLWLFRAEHLVDVFSKINKKGLLFQRKQW